ncbi:MAG: DNA/RNA non-specific endonuclease [Pyrinomonadaceae bacterium]|nr:DNA/RNA non-specific endonuclease [Pyrinomonadaceae bacterium]
MQFQNLKVRQGYLCVRTFAALIIFFALVLSLFQGHIFVGSVLADTNAQTVPFSQNWANTNLISVADDWSGVPGIIGYRGDNLTNATATDPQTILVDGSATPVNVWANQTDPNTFLSGGVAEFDTLANPSVALNGSGTADAPHIVINLNTSGTTAVNVAYNLRDLDGSADDAVQPVALQYRVGNTGNYTNIPSAFVADATTGGSATQVTPVSVVLPAACENQPLVQLRIMTTNANGNDEWVGIDDINITGTGGGNVNLSGIGAANPSTVAAGSATLLTVQVTPANNPASTGITVTGDLSSIGLSNAQTFFDDGTNGDVTAGDNIFSYSATVPGTQTAGSRALPAAISDAQSRTASATINLNVTGVIDPGVHLTLGNPSNATPDPQKPTNYLLVKPQYVMSYHRDRGIPNWVAWHLDPTWLGTTDRQDSFRPDTSLPAGWYQVQANSYSGSGFDRGHHIPSADRTASVADNDSTFFMTNMMPQAPDNNQGPWAVLENYCRDLVNAGNELYIYTGGAGQGGVGSSGAAVTVDAGRVTVPAKTWKVIVVLPRGANDTDRVQKTTRVIAVIMPNTQGIRSTPWTNYRVSVKQVEALTGLNFFTNVRPSVRNILKIRKDDR